MVRRFFSSVLILCVSTWVFAADLIAPKDFGRKNFTYTERTDLRRYDNGRYTGLYSREVRSFITCKNIRDSVSCSGIFYVLQQTKRNMTDVRDCLNVALQSDFTFDSDGGFEMENDCGYPSFRNFPTLPDSKVSEGDTWTGKSMRLVDPYQNGEGTLIPMLVSYKYVKKSKWAGKEVYEISASWATRYSLNLNDENDNNVFDSKLSRANGSHNATLYISCETGAMLLCRDTVDEIFSYVDGKTVAFKGTINLFTDNAAVIDRKTITKSIDTGDITTRESDSGLVLTIKNLQFESDSAILVSGENERLDLIANVLKGCPNSVFLVTGHCASTGNIAGENELSLERAKTIASGLVDRGIKAENVVCVGEGSSKPIATNETPEGRALNRRVEITILE